MSSFLGDREEVENILRLKKHLQGSLGSTEEGRKGNIGCPCLAAIVSR